MVCVWIGARTAEWTRLHPSSTRCDEEDDEEEDHDVVVDHNDIEQEGMKHVQWPRSTGPSTSRIQAPTRFFERAHHGLGWSDLSGLRGLCRLVESAVLDLTVSA